MLKNEEWRRNRFKKDRTVLVVAVFSAAFLTVALLAMSRALRAETVKGIPVAGSDLTCPAQLANGMNYEVHYRTLKARWQGRDVYVVVTAYYKPGSGEFLYYSSILNQEGQPRDFNEKPMWGCKIKNIDVLLLENGEWVDFWGLTSGPRIGVYHSALWFASIGEAWRYVATHFDECQLESGRGKCYDEIPLYKDLDSDFFRPERLRFDARPYDYEPLMSVKKVGSTWEVVISGADEPNRARIVLDEKFKLLKVTRFNASK